MKRVVVLSDTCGVQDGVKDMMTQLHETPPDLIIHLGNKYGDMSKLITVDCPVEQVPETSSEAANDPDVPTRKFLMVEGWRFFITYSPELTTEDLPWITAPKKIVSNGGCDLMLHGQHRRPKVFRQLHSWILCPGDMQVLPIGQYHTTFALMEVEKTHINLEYRSVYHDLDRIVVRDHVFKRLRMEKILK